MVFGVFRKTWRYKKYERVIQNKNLIKLEILKQNENLTFSFTLSDYFKKSK